MIDAGNPPPDAQSLLEDYRQSRALDARFDYLDFLQAFATNVSEIDRNLSQFAEENRRIARAAAWAKPYREREQRLLKNIEGAKGAKPPLWVVAGGLLTPFLGAVISEVAKHAAEIFFHSAPK